MASVSLLDEVVAAHGGADRWASVHELRIQVRTGGNILALRLKSPHTRSLEVIVDARRVHVSLDPFPRRGMRGVFDGRSVRIETNNEGRLLRQREVVRSTVTGAGDPEMYQGARVSAGFFPLLGVKPEFGRNFGPEEDQVGRDHVVILGHALWQSRFGGDPNIIGRPLTIDGEPFTIIGVLPANFRFTRVLNAELELWMPIAFTPQQLTREDRSIVVYGRLKRRVSFRCRIRASDADFRAVWCLILFDWLQQNVCWVQQFPWLKQDHQQQDPSTIFIL
ncbi:MAG TPA: ABC transporter permease [Pyrinomonadaceae bacterium]|nr:ABC transporter permease [Pyrinomonadaceae bacterium]